MKCGSLKVYLTQFHGLGREKHHLRQEAEAKGQNEARVAQANGGSRPDIHYVALVDVI